MYVQYVNTLCIGHSMNNRLWYLAEERSRLLHIVHLKPSKYASVV